MTLLGTATAVSSAPPVAFFDRWADVATWPDWNTDTDWVRLDGPFEQGVTGTMKPTGGPRVRFTVTRLVAGERFTDVSRLWGARLTFDHRVSTGPAGTTVAVEVTLAGPLGALWRRVLGADLRRSLQPDVDNLVRCAEAATMAG